MILTRFVMINTDHKRNFKQKTSHEQRAQELMMEHRKHTRYQSKQLTPPTCLLSLFRAIEYLFFKVEISIVFDASVDRVA